MERRGKGLILPAWALATVALLAASAACAPAAAPAASRPAAEFAPAPTAAPLGGESAARSEPPAAQPRQAAQPAPDFSIETVIGERFRLSDQRGKVVGVLFVASWCGSCVAEAQAWGRVQEEYGPQNVDVLFVSPDPQDTPADLARLREWAKGAPEHHWAIDRDMKALVLPFQVRSLDTTLIFDRQGRLAYRDAGPTPFDWLKRELDKLL